MLKQQTKMLELSLHVACFFCMFMFAWSNVTLFIFNIFYYLYKLYLAREVLFLCNFDGYILSQSAKCAHAGCLCSLANVSPVTLIMFPLGGSRSGHFAVIVF